jgi:hypothetical protein
MTQKTKICICCEREKPVEKHHFRKGFDGRRRHEQEPPEVIQ